MPLRRTGTSFLRFHLQWSTEEDTHMRRDHHWIYEFGDAGNVTSCERQFNLDHRKYEDYRGTRFYDKDSLLSSSSGGSTDWRRMRQDSRSKSGRRTLTHHGHLWLCWSTPVNCVPLVSSSRKCLFPPALETAARVRTRGAGLRSLEGMGPKRFVLSVDDDTEFRSRCEWIIPFFTLKYSIFPINL
jgi:hypothetical protein